MDEPAPLQLLELRVDPAWIDYNGHMNVAYYVLAFDHGTDALLDHLGMDAAYRERSGCSVYVLECHVGYHRELKLGDPLRIDVQIVDYDDKRIHYFERMYHARDGFLAATSELLLMHLALRTVKSTPMPAPALQRLAALKRLHDRLPRPEQLGRRIGIRRR